MRTIYLVLGVALFTCYYVSSAPLTVLCGEQNCQAKECKTYTASHKYKNFIDLNTLPNVSPPGYIVRIPFYVLGRKDALIVLSTKNNPDWKRDNVYEFLIGGSFNRVTIRRRRDGEVMRELQIPKTISADKTTQFMIEISVGGEIVVYSSQFKDRPLIVAYDPTPMKVRYISFGPYVDYFYDCQKDTPFSTVAKHPLLNTDLLGEINAENTLEKFCSKYDTWDYEYKHFQEISDINPLLQPEGFWIRFPFYVVSKKNAHILLSLTKYPNELNDSMYEIVLGGTGFFHIQIRRRKGKEVLAKLGRPNLLNPRVPIKFVLEISKDGQIAIYSQHDPFVPLITAHDPNPLPIKFLSFASKDTLSQFYFNCVDDNKDAPVMVPIKLPSRIGEDDTGVVGDKWGLKQCQTIQVKDNHYTKFFPLESLSNVHEGVLVSLPLLIQGERNAHIILTTTDKPNWETDSVYEFVIGGWDDTGVAIRRKRNGEVLQEEQLSNSISRLSPTKFLLTITSTGEIVVFTDLSKYKPLIWASDPDPLAVKYVAFASNDSEVVDYYFGCPSFKQKIDVVTVLPSTEIANEKVVQTGISTEESTQVITQVLPQQIISPDLMAISIHPLLQNPMLYQSFDMKALAYYSRHYETWKDSFDTLTPVSDRMRPNGFMLRFPLYVQGPQNAHILLSTDKDLSSENAKIYEIRLGEEGNTLSQIIHKASGEVLAKIYEQNLLSDTRPLRVIIEISNMGLMKVYTAHNPFAPLLQALIPPLTQINYVSFASPSRMQFYYNVNEHNLLTKPVPSTEVMENMEKVKHPLLSIVDYPVGFTELFFRKYMKSYETTGETSGKYVHFLPLDEFEGVHPHGYLLRMPFYIEGVANAHILLSPIENPSTEDNTYEILIGGSDNSRVEIRKRIHGHTLAEAHVPHVLTEMRKVKFVLEVSSSGDIKLYSEDSPYRPLVTAFDPSPVPFKYVSFRNDVDETLKFYYGNPPRDNPEVLVADLLSDLKEKLIVHPLLQHWNNVNAKIDMKKLVMGSQYIESWTNEFDSFYPLDKRYKPKGYYLRFPLFVQGDDEVRILLSTSEKPDQEKHYEIVIGVDNVLSQLYVANPEKSLVATSTEQNLMSLWRPMKLILEVSVDGTILVYTSHNPFMPLLRYMDPEPIDVGYISIASPKRVSVFYNVDETLIVNEPTVITSESQVDVTELIKHPMLAEWDYPIGLAEQYFHKYFKLLQTKPDVNNRYLDFVKLLEIPHVQPEGYILRLPFYLRAKANAFILLSKEENPSPDDDAYEIVLGGWGNTRVVIRKRINGAVLADYFIPDLLSEHRRKKFVLEITTLGEIKLYSEDDFYHPLVSTIDPMPIHVEYISIKNINKEHIEFFYGNVLPHLDQSVVQELIKAEAPDAVIHPWMINFDTLIERISLPIIHKHSSYYESWEPTYTQFVKLEDKWHPQGFRVRFPFYVQGWKDARILLSSTQAPDPMKDNVYEIRIGAEGNSLNTISRKINGAVMKEVYEQNILSPHKLIMLVIELTDEGRISVYSSHNPYVPLISTFDSSPLDIKYVSFGSNSRVQFFYGVDYKTILSMPALDKSENLVGNVIESVQHPMLTSYDYPVGAADLYFKKYTKEYVTLSDQPNSYIHFMKLNDLSSIRPEGYFLRFPFFVQGSQMAHVLLSSKEYPNEHDNAYELVMGDYSNSRIVLRKRINGAVLANIYWPNTLSQFRRKKFVFEVQTDGVIRLWSIDNPFKPLLVAYDPVPVAMNFLSFKSWLPEKMVFNYDNTVWSDDKHGMETIKEELLKNEYKTLSVHPLLMNWHQVEKKLNMKSLLLNSKYYESWLNGYEKYIPLTEEHKPSGFLLRFPFYVQGPNTAKILLSTKENPNMETDSVYEIHIGKGGNSWNRILKNGVELTRVYEQNLLNIWKPMKVVIEVTTDGLVKVFTSHNPWVPLMKVMSTPIDVKYVSFSSRARIQYFYDVNEEGIIAAPQRIHTHDVSINVKHPLFDVVDYPVGVSDLFFDKYYKKLEVTPDLPSSYRTWVKLEDIGNVRPNGYYLRMPFFLQGTQNAHIVWSPKENPTLLDNVYELVVGGWKNMRIVLRKRINGAILADFYAPNVLSEFKKKKFVFEITADGEFNLYSEEFPYKPLFTAYDWLSEDFELNYMSMKNVYDEKLSLYYGSLPALKMDKVVTDLLHEKYKTLAINPLFNNWHKLSNVVSLKLLSKYSKHLESWVPFYEHFIPVADVHRPAGYLLRFPFYVQGPRHARILLSTTDKPELDRENAYEIHIGKAGNTVTAVLRNLNGIELGRVVEQGIMCSWSPVKMLIEVTTEGLIQVFTSRNPFLPLISVKDSLKPIPINYISFASPARALFFYDTDEDSIVKLPAKEVESKEATQLFVKHPLLMHRDYPLGLSDIYFRQYFKSMTASPEQSGNYTTWVNMNDIYGVRPKGYLIRLPFYLIGSRNAHVVLSEYKAPTELDNAYELVIGGFDNSRVLIRKRINGAVLADVYWPNVLSDTKYKKFVFEVTLAGDIHLYSEDNPYKPLVKAYDPYPSIIDYMSLKNMVKETLVLYYGNPPTGDRHRIVNEMLKVHYGNVAVNPLLETWKLLRNRISLKALALNGRYFESWTPRYSQFWPIKDNYRPFGYKLRFPVYVSGEHDAKILLSPHPSPTLEDDVYEISIGAESNSVIGLSRRINGEYIEFAHEQDLLSSTKPIKVIIEVTNEGVIKVFTSYNPWSPVFTHMDPNPIDIKFYSFSSSSRVQFFHEVNEEPLKLLPEVKHRDVEVFDVSPEKHPLFEHLDYPIGLSEPFFKKYFKTFITTPKLSNKYVQFVKLVDVDALHPDNYLLRVPFYVRGSENAHILFSEVQNPTALDNAYELLLGGWGNNHIILRKRIQGTELANIYWPRVLTEGKLKKFVFEVTVDGEIKLYSEESPYAPIFTAFDVVPIKVQFMSFKNYLTERLEFFWGKAPELPVEKIIAELNPEAHTVHPLLINWEKIHPIVDVESLFLHGKLHESWSDLYDKVWPIDAAWTPSGYNLRMPIWMQGHHDAKVLLSLTDKPLLEPTVYELTLGAHDNSMITLSKQVGGDYVHRVYEQGLLSPWKPSLFIVEISADGLIQVFSAHNPFSPVFSWKDTAPLPVKYFSLGSQDRVLFFHNVDEMKLLTFQRPEVLKAKHPLLSVLDLSIGLKDMLLKKMIRLFQTVPYESSRYMQFVKIDDFELARAGEYKLRFPFFVKGSSNAHILLSPQLNPSSFDDAYEIVIGAWNNQRIIIRKRINGAVLADVVLPRVLSPYRLKKFVLDVTSNGMIHLYGEDDLYNPLISAFDPVPVPINYVSFKNYMTEHLEFYYGYWPKEKTEVEVVTMNPLIIDPIAVEKPVPEPINWEIWTPEMQTQWKPEIWTANWNTRTLETKILAKNSKYYESWEPEYLHSVEMAAQYKPAGYIVRFPLYLQGSRDAYILLSNIPNPTADDDVYEIQIGSNGNTYHQITRKINGKVLAYAKESGILSLYKPTKLVIELTQDGLLRVFTSKNPYAPLLQVHDVSPVDVKYLSFASRSRMQYFYDVNEPTMMAKKDKWATELGIELPKINTWIVDLKLPADTEDVYFKNHFKVYETTESSKYETWIKVNDIEGIRPEGHLIRFPFFIQGTSNAHVLLSSVENPSLKDNVYELIIGGFDNTRVMLRKRFNGMPLANVIYPNVLNVLKKKQFVFEISASGDIYLYSGDQPTHPLLVAFDPLPVDIKFISFKNSNAAKVNFFYGYNPEAISNVIVPVEVPATKAPSVLEVIHPTLLPLTKEIDIFGGDYKPIDVFDDMFKQHKEVEITVEPVQVTNTIGTKEPKVVKFEPVVLHPLMEEILPANVELPSLVKNSQYLESWTKNYSNFIKVSGKLQPSGFFLRFPFYVRSPHDAYILLSVSETPELDEDVYEIQLGTFGNSQLRILRKKTGEVLAQINEDFILNDMRPTKIVIEVTKQGIIRVYSQQNPWAPLLTAVDPKPLPIKYVSFASASHTQFFYDVNEKIWLQPSEIVDTDAEHVVVEPKAHPLLIHEDIPIGKEELWFNTYFKVFNSINKKNYESLFNLADIKNVKPEGYYARLPFYVEGPHSAHILLTPKTPVTEFDDAYEIVIGGWRNTRVEIRKRWSGPLLGWVEAPNVLSPLVKQKFVLEVTVDGWIHLWSDKDLLHPLISAYDPKPINVNWLGFRSTDDAPVKFYYDYQPRLDSQQMLTNLMPARYELSQLKSDCIEHLAEGTEFKQFLKISDLSLTKYDQFGKSFSFFVDGTKDASIVLSTSGTPHPELDIVYEILIGCHCKNKPVVIPRKLSDALWYDQLSNVKLVKIDVEIANGKIRLFRDDQIDPLTEAVYDTSLDLNFVSFGAANQVGPIPFFYNCLL